MNLRIYNRCVEVAKALKSKTQNGKSHHVSFAIRKSKIVCIGVNNYTKSHNYNRFGTYKNYKNLPGEYRASLHSECSLLIRLGEEDLSDYEILNIRINNNNGVSLSAPCPNCQRVILATNPKKIFYSNTDGNLQELILE